MLLNDGQVLMGCPGCDLLVVSEKLGAGESGYCPRCGTKIVSAPRRDLATIILCFSLAGLLFYIPAIFSPLLTMDAMGLTDQGSILKGAITFYHAGFSLVAVVVLLTSVLLPLVKHLLLFTASLTLQFGYRPRWIGYLLRLYNNLWEWGMDEVYLIGIMVTLIKVHSMATIHYEIGFFAFLGLVVCTVGLSLCYNPHYFWGNVDQSQVKGDGIEGMFVADSARESGLMLCHDCLLLFKEPGHTAGGPLVCPRCESPAHFRKNNSLTRTWALLIAATILFFPANFLPIMSVTFLGSVEQSTIMDGILYFFNHGSFGIGVIILTASIFVPLFKMVGLFLILLSIHFKWESWLRHKTAMLRFIVFIGRWSMLDIFVIALLCALVDFSVISSVAAAPAVSYFSGVVVLTMLAAHAFDSRLLWDTKP